MDWGNGARLLSFKVSLSLFIKDTDMFFIWVKPKQEGDLIHNFKMWLAEDDDAIPKDTKIKTIADYLEKIHQHILDELEKRLDPRYSTDQFAYVK